MDRSFRDSYRLALTAEPDRLHFAAHSHHFWPDCTRDAHLSYWDDANRLADEKWAHIFGTVVPTAQGHIAEILGTGQPAQICLGPSAHAFVARILSCFEPGKPLRVLTTDSEFHSFDRQMRRWEELDWVSVERVSVDPFDTFQSRLELAAAGAFDLVYLSHVFFNSGLQIPSLADVVAAVPNDDTVIVVDGYHAFCAVPLDLQSLAHRIFYITGGYKYAQSGEGVCGLHVPADTTLRPLDTGWFATFGDLSSYGGDGVAFPNDGWRFAGATFDPTGTYRFNAVMKWWEDEGIDVEVVHQHVQRVKAYFMERLRDSGIRRLDSGLLIQPADALNAGHFLTFRMDDAQSVVELLATHRIITDARSDRLRFGFGLYHDEEMVDALIQRLLELENV